MTDAKPYTLEDLGGGYDFPRIKATVEALERAEASNVRLRETIGKREQEHLAACADLDEALARAERAEAALAAVTAERDGASMSLAEVEALKMRVAEAVWKASSAYVSECVANSSYGSALDLAAVVKGVK